MTEQKKDPRQTALDEIRENAKRARDEEAGQEYTPPVPAEEEEDSKKMEQIPENGNYTIEGEENQDLTPDPQVVEESDPDPVEPAEPEPAEEMVTAIIDGVEQQVPKSKIYDMGLKTLQKELAADKRLEEATKKIREADAYQAAVKVQVEKQLRAAQKEDNGGEPLSRKQDADVATKARKIISQMFDGEEEEAAAALAEILSGRDNATPQIDQGSLVEQVTERVQAVQDHKDALGNFKTKYPEIVNDANLWNMADQQTIQIKQERPDIGLSELMEEAGRRVMEWVDSVRPAPEVVNPGQTAKDKREAKRTMDNIPTARSARQPKKEAPRPPTHSEIVARMRKSRGLPA